MLAAGAILLVGPPATIAYATWQENTVTQQWEATLPPDQHPPAPEAVLAAAPADASSSPSQGEVVFALKIPRLGYNEAVRQGVTSSVLSLGPGHYPTTVEPGQLGDVGIAAHNTYWLGFSAVRPGDQIVLETSRSDFTYVVTGSAIVAPDEIWVLYRPGGRRLTLTTCWPLWAGALAQERLAIFADLSPTQGGDQRRPAAPLTNS